MANLISIVGVSGVGKTTLVKALLRAGRYTAAFEQHAGRPFQALYQRDTRYGLANQVDYLVLRAEQEIALRAAPHTALVDGGLDLDFHGFTRLFHARGWLSAPEFALCQRLYQTLRNLLPLPELIVRLKADRETILSRLSTRDRINIAPVEDIALFEKYLDEWLSTIDPIYIIEVDVSAQDPQYANLIPDLMVQFQERLTGQ